MKQLQEADIITNSGQKTYERGSEYFEQGRVLSLSVEQDETGNVRLESTTQGSGDHIYKQAITIEWEDGYVDINGECTCPVRHDCKHVAAACLEFQAKGEPQKVRKVVNDACLSWLSAFSQSLNTPEQTLAPGNEFLIYILTPAAQTGKIDVAFHIAHWLEQGGLSKGRQPSLSNFSEATRRPKYAQLIDQEIGQLLQATGNYSWDKVELQGELGLHALTKMVTTGRCYWQNTETSPLYPGEERELELQWLEDDQEQRTLDVSITHGALLILTQPAVYLDPQAGEVGPLNNVQLSTSQLEALLAAPAVPPELVTEFSQRVAMSLPGALLPPPETVEFTTIKSQPPVPRIRLAMRDYNDQPEHLIKLRFAYEGHIISCLPEQLVSHINTGSQLVNIERQLDAERHAIKQLKSLGFDAAPDYNETDLIFHNRNQNHTPMQTAAQWNRFLSHVLPVLQQQGWFVEQDDNFLMEFHQAPLLNAGIEEEHEGSDWFNLSFDIEINEQPVSILPLIAQVLESYEPTQLPETLSLHLGDGQYLNIASAQIKPIIDTLYELYNADSLQSDGSLRLSRFDAARLDQLNNSSEYLWQGGDALRKLGKNLNNFKGIQDVSLPEGLNATLRHYQQQGVNWLQFLREYQFGGILADDMGLGKTVQTLAHLLIEKEQGRMTKPCLIVAPTSLMSNWRRETEQFAPALKVLVLQGPERHERFSQIQDHNLILTTYPLLARDEEHILAHEYHALVLDEAQVVKNPRAKAAQMVRQIKADQRLCLTGTPMENHLGELWALFDFLMPGFLGDARQFTNVFRTPIEKYRDNEMRKRLAQRVAPFMLRRTKAEVVEELPDKTEIICNVTLDKEQAALYESIRIAMADKVRQTIATKGLSRSHITILDALLKLRQVCCDPRLLSLTQAHDVEESAKLELLMQMVPEMVEEGRRILIFSQFTKMLGHIETELQLHEISYSKLTGQTRHRDDAIEKFKKGEANVFLISLKAGGVGLNLTEADTVIHYDPWWNPAAENQATDRAHRIGQKKAVFVYKFVTENSVEEKIIAMQAKKQALAQGVYDHDDQGEDLKLTSDDMQMLFAPLGQ